MKSFLRIQLLFAFCAIICVPRVNAQSYIPHILASPPDSYAKASDINDSGQIVGSISGGLPWKGQAIFWNEYSSGPLSIDEDNSSASAQLINNTGLVIGSHDHPPGYSNPFSWHAGGGITNLDWFPVIQALNDRGTMAGWKYDPVIGQIPVSVTDMAQVNDLESLFGGRGEAADINNLDYMVGTSYYTDRWGGRATLWPAGEAAVDLGLFGGTWSHALGINNLGQVVVHYGDDYGGIGNVIWSLSGETLSIPSYSLFDGGLFGAIDINDDGIVLGNTQINGVNTVVTWSQAQGFTIVGTGIANAINNSGWIVGAYDLNDNRAVVWEPVPEPSSFFMLVAGIGCLAAMVRRVRS